VSRTLIVGDDILDCVARCGCNYLGAPNWPCGCWYSPEEDEIEECGDPCRCKEPPRHTHDQWLAKRIREGVGPIEG